jgi:hypothetical protein
LAETLDASLRLAGVSGGEDGEDASGLLASVSFVVQWVARVAASRVLVEAGEEGLVGAVGGAGLVFGLSAGWQKKGLDQVREGLARRAAAPTLYVRKGPRSGGLAPEASRTRCSWSLAGSC